jgi:hypothetical protein
MLWGLGLGDAEVDRGAARRDLEGHACDTFKWGGVASGLG